MHEGLFFPPSKRITQQKQGYFFKHFSFMIIKLDGMMAQGLEGRFQV